MMEDILAVAVADTEVAAAVVADTLDKEFGAVAVAADVQIGMLEVVADMLTVEVDYPYCSLMQLFLEASILSYLLRQILIIA